MKDKGGVSTSFHQLKKYARDLAQIYKSEKQKRSEIDSAYKQLLKYADDLNSTIYRLNEKNRELNEAYLDTIHRLVLAAEFKDEDTGDHIIRMSHYSSLIAVKINLSQKVVENIFYAAPMHDIGKIGIADYILMKTGNLTLQEYEIMKTHTFIGAKILADSKAEILQLARTIALSHHEKWNGTGYPHGLARTDIPIEGRIVSVADTFDALTSRRPYKDPYPVDVACKIINKERGKHFEPRLVDVFLENMEQIIEIRNSVNPTKSFDPVNFSWSERDLEGPHT